MSLLDRIRSHARRAPNRSAVVSDDVSLDYSALAREVERVADILSRSGVRTLALAIDNGPAWAVLDLAALTAGLCLVPLPQFFTPEQTRHALRQSDAQALLTHDLGWGQLGEPAETTNTLEIAGQRLAFMRTGGQGVTVPAGVHKVTYTSGTTGAPKGVMLGWSHIRPVVQSLVEAAEVKPDDRHLALLPLAVLLENIGGIYAPLWAGATTVLPALHRVGLRGSSGLDTQRMHRALDSYGATTTIFTPQSLLGLVERLEAERAGTLALRFAAVGGAPVSPRLLRRAEALELPVYEGYGLSECASVVCLNTPKAHRPGTVGRPLRHTAVRVSEDGEVLVSGAGFAGYLDAPPPPDGWWATGDLGRLDAEGFLHLHGRRRNVFITAFGRNVAPEWVERELTVEPAIAQAAVFGEARPWNTAVIVPTPGTETSAVAAAVESANGGLPDYARIRRWLPAEEPFTPDNGLLTGTGRVRREAVYARYSDRIQPLYREETHAS